MRIESFEPIVDKNSTIIILGTMPSVTSLKLKEYYAHRNNLFWDIIFRVCDQTWRCDEVVTASYDEKVDLSQRNGIAIWDVLKYCDRKGNLDKDITNQTLNDFSIFFKKYPTIQKVFFNGQKAEKYFNDHIDTLAFNNMKFKTLQSTSPSNTTNSFYILKEWMQILDKD